MENYSILKTLLTFPVKQGGWHMELNLISWFNRMPVYDLREWDSDRKMKKGITLSKEELSILKEKLQEVEL
mgnify:CR=1 FL=1